MTPSAVTSIATADCGPKLQGLIGPHEGIELSLLLAYAKPAALMTFAPISDFLPWVARGWLVWGVIQNCGRDFRWGHSDIFTQPSESWRIARLGEIYADVRAAGRMRNHHHAEVGQLLGYTEEQISAFLAQPD